MRKKTAGLIFKPVFQIYRTISRLDLSPCGPPSKFIGYSKELGYRSLLNILKNDWQKHEETFDYSQPIEWICSIHFLRLSIPIFDELYIIQHVLYVSLSIGLSGLYHNMCSQTSHSIHSPDRPFRKKLYNN